MTVLFTRDASQAFAHAAQHPSLFSLDSLFVRALSNYIVSVHCLQSTRVLRGGKEDLVMNLHKIRPTYCKRDGRMVWRVCTLTSKLSCLGSNPNPVIDCHPGVSQFHRQSDSSMVVPSLECPLNWSPGLPVFVGGL